MSRQELEMIPIEEMTALQSLHMLVYIGRDMIRTARFSRGGYDGPFLRPRHVQTTSTSPFREICGGQQFPVALLIEFTGTGIPTDYLLISDDRGAMEGGYKIAAGSDISIATGNPIRIIADRHQQYFVQTVTKANVSIRLRVMQGRL